MAIDLSSVIVYSLYTVSLGVLVVHCYKKKSCLLPIFYWYIILLDNEFLFI